MLVVIAQITAKPGLEQELEDHLKAFVPQVQEEEGTRMYTLHRSVGSAGQFLFYEMYRDKAAFKHHGSTPYFQELLSQIGGLLAEGPVIEFYEDLASINR